MKKTCGGCGAENHRPAKKCVSCGAPFVPKSPKKKKKKPDEALGTPAHQVPFAAGIAGCGSLVLMWPERGELITLTPEQSAVVFSVLDGQRPVAPEPAHAT